METDVARHRTTDIELTRVFHGEATLGTIQVRDKFFVTLENPWMNNKPLVSCIPTGKYEVVPVKSSKFGDTYMVKDVPNRSHILFHAGNTEADTDGCILVGSMFGQINGHLAVLASRAAFQGFLKVLRTQKSWTLLVRGPYLSSIDNSKKQ